MKENMDKVKIIESRYKLQETLKYLKNSLMFYKTEGTIKVLNCLFNNIDFAISNLYNEDYPDILIPGFVVDILDTIENNSKDKSGEELTILIECLYESLQKLETLKNKYLTKEL